MYTLTMFFETLALADLVEANVDSLIEIKVDSMKGFCSEKAFDKQFLADNLQILEANKFGLGRFLARGNGGSTTGTRCVLLHF